MFLLGFGGVGDTLIPLPDVEGIAPKGKDARKGMDQGNMSTTAIQAFP